MIKQTTFTCDICKQDYTIGSDNQQHAILSYSYKLNRNEGYDEDARTNLDLCPNCAKKLKQFLANQL